LSVAASQKTHDGPAVPARNGRCGVCGQTAWLADYRAGKEKLFGFFVGQVMKEMKGKGNPGLVNEALKRRLG
jgi:hypothetical protein